MRASRCSSLTVGFLFFIIGSVVMSVPQIHAGFVPFSGGVNPDDVATVETIQGKDSVALKLKFPGMHVSKHDRDGNSYDQVTINNCGLKGDIGEPYLPFKGVFVEVPAGVDLKVNVNSRKDSIMSGSYLIIPNQPPEPDVKLDKPREFVINKDVYAHQNFLPDEIVRIARDGVIRGRRVIFLEISPIQYNPAKKLIRAISSLDLTIEFSGKIDSVAEMDKRRLASPAFERQAEVFIKNYQPIEPVQGSSSRQAADYLIICDDQFYDELAPLYAWKTLKGFLTEVVTLTDVGGTGYTDIENYIQDAYDNWSPAPTYVLLVGDHGLLPSYPVTPDAYGDPFISDLPYSLCQGTDYWPDIFLGRLSVQTEAECTTVVNKIMAYDRNPEIDDWYHDALIAAYLQDYDDYNCTADRWFFETGTYIMDFLENTVGMGIYTAMCNDNDCGLTGFHFRSGSYPHRPTPVPDPVPTAWTSLFTSSSQATTDVTTAINTGVGFVQHRDHGGETGWGDPPYNVSHVNALTNGSRTPVIFSVNCLTGAMDYSSDCFAEAFQKKSNGGAVGIVAATRVSYSGWNDLFCHGTYTCFWPNYDSSHSGNPYNNTFRVCEAMAFGKYYMYEYEGDSAATLYSFRLFHWFGDPELDMRTDTPQSPTATIPSNIIPGITQITIPCSDTGALVAVSQDGVLLGSAIVSGGQAVINLSSAVQPVIDVAIVISGTQS